MGDALENLEQHLRIAPILSAIRGVHGAHPSYRFVLEGGVYVIAKPADEAGANETWVRNEVAAWVVLRHLGWTDMMGATVLRTIPSLLTGNPVEASLQVLWPAAEDAPAASSFSDEEAWKTAIFDVVTAASDRGGHNWLGVGLPGQPKALKLIDHGHAFQATPGGIESTFFELKKGQQLADWTVEALTRLTDPALDDALYPLLSPDRLAALRRRLSTLLSQRVLIFP
jgi:hypothetical protein